MKKTLLTLFLAAFVWGIADAQVRLSAKYNYPTLPGTSQDSVLNGLKSIRGCAFALDVDGDNRSEIAVTNYARNGRICVFEAAGNDSMRLVWTSPLPPTPGNGASPRFVTFGDLDNDGRKEVIYQVTGTGFLIFEWDGVVGSDNYGTQPSQIIGLPFLTGLTSTYTEYYEVLDIDGDGTNELVSSYDSTPVDNDKYYVISALGDWTTNDPGFSSFNVEYSFSRTSPGATAYGLNGSPIAMIPANFDGAGNKEILIHNWNLKNVMAPVRVTGPNTFVLPDTTTGRASFLLGTTAFDDVSLFGGMAYDIDGDGREEVYLPTLAAAGSTNNGFVHMISYNTGQPTTVIDSTNVTKLSAGYTGTTFGYGYGDIDADGRKEIYTSGSYPNNVAALEFQGGDKRNPANWIARILYRGDSTIYTAITYRDSVGIRDTTRTVDPSFASKIYGRNTDFDRDGREDIILPYQALSDSISISRLTWNAGLSKYDTVLSKLVNTKRWGLRVIERDPSAGVEAKDITIITPDDYRLDQNYPNPFNPSTTIAFYLPIKDKISLKVYDLLGREVRTLINNEDHERGTGRIVWDGRDNAGKVAATGTYFYTLKFGNFEKTNKMLLVK